MSKAGCRSSVALYWAYGKSSYDFRNNDWDSYRNTYIGFVFQEYNLIENYSVGTNVALALEMQAEKQDRAVIDAMLTRVGLVDGVGATLYDRKINELSGGQKQRVAIARALIKNPEIILADDASHEIEGRLFKKRKKEMLTDIIDKIIIKSDNIEVILLPSGVLCEDKPFF